MAQRADALVSGILRRPEKRITLACGILKILDQAPTRRLRDIGLKEQPQEEIYLIGRMVAIMAAQQGNGDAA